MRVLEGSGFKKKGCSVPCSVCLEFAHETGSRAVLSAFNPNGGGKAGFACRLSFRDPQGLDARKIPEWRAVWNRWIAALGDPRSKEAFPVGWTLVRRFVELPDGRQIESPLRG